MTEDTPSTQSVRVYSYACKILYDHDAAVVENQLALAHRYRNKLTEILLQERTAYRKIVSRALGADLAALEEQLDSLNDTIQCLTTDINRAKQVNQTRKPEPTLAQALKDARARRKICYGQIKAAKQTAQADPSISAKIADSKEVIADTIRTERKTYSQKYGLYWPNYLEAERAANKSRFSKHDPKFRRWTGEGSLAIQFQGGLTIQDLFQCEDSRLQIPRPSDSAIRPGNQVRGPGRHVHVKFRAKSTDSGGPQWIVLLATLHRLPPDNAIIKWAHLDRRKSPRATGRRDLSLIKDYDYTLRLTVEESLSAHRYPAPQRLVAAEVGWRSVEAGLRVAIAMDESGHKEELILPREWLEGLRKADSFASIIDRHVNATWPVVAKALPETQSLFNLAKGSTRRIANTLLRIATERPACVAELDAWKERHRHLLRYQYGLRSRLLRARREAYRHFVFALRSAYNVCGIEQFDLRNLKRNDVSQDEPPLDIVKWNSNAAAVSLLTRMLKEKMPVVQLDPKDSTHLCSYCGSLERFDAALYLAHTCKACGSTWDQDENAARNLLSRLRECLSEQKNAGGARNEHPHEETATEIGLLPDPS